MPNTVICLEPQGKNILEILCEYALKHKRNDWLVPLRRAIGFWLIWRGMTRFTNSFTCANTHTCCGHHVQCWDTYCHLSRQDSLLQCSNLVTCSTCTPCTVWPRSLDLLWQCGEPFLCEFIPHALWIPIYFLYVCSSAWIFTYFPCVCSLYSVEAHFLAMCAPCAV